MASEKHLWNRGRGRQNWYLRLPVPRSIRKHWPASKTGMIIRPLGTDSLVEARRLRDRLTVAYRDVFDQIAAGERPTAEQIEAATKPAPKLLDSMIGVYRGGEDMSSDTLVRVLAELKELNPGLRLSSKDAPAVEVGETISTAAESWLKELERTGVRATTLDGHRLRVRAFIEACGDVTLGSVTRASAAYWLAKVAHSRSNRTTNAYAVTLKALYASAKQRGRFQGENPFDGQRRKVVGESYAAFTNAEIKTLLAAFPREIKPKRHTPETALGWVALIGAYTGMRLEEICQLTVSDVQTRGSNGGTVVVFDIHNGDKQHHLKNESSARAIPVHSELVRAGLLKYIKALPKDGPLFPGLKRRESKGGKIGARVGELFRKQLIALGIKQDGKCFHSFRHTVAQRLEAAEQSQTDAARVLGHAIAGMSFGVYSTGPGLKRLAAVVEAINYSDD